MTAVAQHITEEMGHMHLDASSSSSHANSAESSPPDSPQQLDAGEQRVTMWNAVDLRKISGNAAPKRRNLQRYVARNPGVQVYDGQDLHLTKEQQELRTERESARTRIFNRRDGRIYSGNAAPLLKNLKKYLAAHPECEVYVPGMESRYLTAPSSVSPLQMATTMPPLPACVQAQGPIPACVQGSQYIHQQPQYFPPQKTTLDDLWQQPMSDDLFLPCKPESEWDGWEQQLCCMPLNIPESPKLQTDDFDFGGIDKFMETTMTDGCQMGMGWLADGCPMGELDKFMGLAEGAFVTPVSCLNCFDSCFQPEAADMDIDMGMDMD